jgi:hypothetical protein
MVWGQRVGVRGWVSEGAGRARLGVGHMVRVEMGCGMECVEALSVYVFMCAFAGGVWGAGGGGVCV